MNPTLILSIVLCCMIAACGAKAPSSDQIQKMVDKAVKAENPTAEAKLTDIQTVDDGKAVSFRFTCTNCLLQDAADAKKVVPSAQGEGTAWLDPQDGTWKIQQATMKSEDGSMFGSLGTLTGMKF